MSRIAFDASLCEAPKNMRGLSLLYRLTQQVEVTESGCIEFTGWLNPKGYGRIRCRGKKTQTHRAVYEEFVGPIPAGLLVCHTCDNPPCCNPEHLFLGSHSENQLDAVSKGRQGMMHGEAHPSSKLTMEIARQIRQCRGVELGRTVADRFGVGTTTVFDIWSGKRWPENTTKLIRRTKHAS